MVGELDGDEQKTFAIPGPAIREIIPDRRACIATDRIMVDGRAVGCTRRYPVDEPVDSGWVFFAGDEDQEYLNEPSNFGVYAVNTVAGSVSV